MPQVPGLVPDQTPSMGGTPDIALGVPVDAFGGAVGHALSGLGHDIEGASDKIWAQAMNMQNLQNETEAKSADADYMMRAGMLHAQFNAKEGNNASPEALQAHIQELQDLRVKTRGGLTNPMAQKLFDGSSLSFMGRTIFNAAGHAAQQTKVAANNASTSRVAATQDAIEGSPTDDVTFQRGKRAIESEVESQGRNSGWSPEQIEETKKQKVSETFSKRTASLARTDAIGAQKMYEQGTKSGAILPMDALRVQATVQTQFRQQGSRIIADQVLGKLRDGDDEGDKSLNDYISEGMAKVTEGDLDKNDPLFKDFVRERITADYNRHKSVVRDGQQQAEQTVASAMMTGNKEGILPKSVDELKLIDPKVSDAWDSMKPTTQKKYMQALAQNARGERVAWTDDSLRNYQQMKGQAHDDPVAFLARDVVSENLPTSGKRELINLQQRLRAQSESDPRVARAISILTPDLRAAGIDRTNKEDYYQFVGALQDQLDQFQKDNKKVPKPEEVRKIGAQLMQEQATGRRGWLYFTDETTPTYQLPVPDEEMTRLRNDPDWAAQGVKPTDKMLERVYRAQKFRKLYGGSAKSDKGKPGVTFPPNAPKSE